MHIPILKSRSFAFAFIALTSIFLLHSNSLSIISNRGNSENSYKNNSKLNPRQKQTAATVGNSSIELVQLTDSIYQTEHAVFIIADSDRVQWPDYYSLYSKENRHCYYYSDTLKSLFPKDYTTIAIIAANLEPYKGINIIPGRYKTSWNDGNDLFQRGAYDLVRYHTGPIEITQNVMHVFDHEIGHGWHIFGPADRYLGHYFPNSTVWGIMSTTYIDANGYSYRILGNPEDGFEWDTTHFSKKYQTETFSEQMLYSMGLRKKYPDTYLLEGYKFNDDGTVSYTSYTKWDHESITEQYGPRNPSYLESVKRFHMGFIYVARDYNEIKSVYKAIESSIKYFTYAEEINTSFKNPFEYRYEWEIPFLPLTHLRASVNTRLSDLDGNSTPELNIAEKNATIKIGETAIFNYTTSDADGEIPELTSLTYADFVNFTGNNIAIGPIDSAGTYFFTIKATDSGGKKTFDHFVVDVESNTTSVDEKGENLPDEYKLSQNYPNPFNPSTTIKFQIPANTSFFSKTRTQQGLTKLIVYDILGREVTTLINKEMRPGSYEVKFDGSSLSSGIYFYRLTSGEFIQTRKMMLLK